MNFLAVALLAASVSAGAPYLVKDFTPDPVVSEVQGGSIVTVGDVFFFTGTDGGFWRSDGTEVGTWRIADDAPGRRLSSGYARPVVMGDDVYYGVHTETQFFLYRTDGSTAGTHRVAELPKPSGQVEIAACGDAKICFTVDADLAVTDGTAAGTVILPLASPKPSLLTTVGRNLFFRGREGLWVSDGTAAGTRLLKSFPESSGVYAPAESGGRLFFNAPDPERRGYALWISDGTDEGTRPLTPIFCASCALKFVTFRDRTYVTGLGRSILRTDGTREGTSFVAALPEYCQPCGFGGFSLLHAGESLVLSVSDGDGRTFMWSFDGEHEPEELTSGYELLGYLPATKRWYYTIGSGETRPKQLWSFDGTSQHKIATLPEGFRAVATWGLGRSRLAIVNRWGPPRPLIFDATTNELRELTITRRATGHSDPFALFGAGDRLYFATSIEREVSLHVTDGTEAGTTRLGTVSPFGTFISDAGRIYYRGGGRLSITDGTSAGTRSLSIYGSNPPAFLGETPIFVSNGSLFRGNADGSVEKLFTASWMLFPRAVGNRVLFWARTGMNETGERWSLHVSDGTASGTHAQAPETHRYGSDFLVDGDRAFFATWERGDRAQMLWVTDGAPDGTKPLRRIEMKGGGIVPEVVWNGIAYFRVTIVGAGWAGELWRSDGTPEGTYRLSTATFTRVTLVRNRLVLLNTVSDLDIWTSDGTPSGTRRHRKSAFRSPSRPFPLPNGGIGIALIDDAHPERFEIYDITGNTSTFVALGALRMERPQNNAAIHYANERLYFIGIRLQGTNLWAVPLTGGSPAELTDVELTYAGLTRWKNGWGAVFRVVSEPRGADIPIVVAETIAGTLREDIDYERFTSTIHLEHFAEATVVVPIREGASGTMSIALTAVSGARVVNGFATANVPSSRRRAVSH